MGEALEVVHEDELTNGTREARANHERGPSCHAIAAMGATAIPVGCPGPPAAACDESGRGVVDPAGLLVAALGLESSSLSSPKSKFSASCFNKRAFSSINSFKAFTQKVSN